MPTFKQMALDLKTLTQGQVADADIRTLLNKSMEEECEAFQWSTLFKTGVIWGIPDNTFGVVNLVQGSKRVVGFQTQFPTTFPDYAPPENWVIVAGSQYMPLDVSRFVSSVELELAEPWGDVSQSNVNFNLRPQFYSVPGGAQVFIVRQILPVLPMSRHMLSLVDPARIAGTSTPSVGHVEAGYDLQGNVRIELWLRPGGVEAYVVEFRERFKPMVSDNAWPQIPMNVLEAKALMYCYYTMYASQANGNWLQLAQQAKIDYQSQLSKAQADDIERQVKTTQSYDEGYELVTILDQAGPPGPVFGR